MWLWVQETLVPVLLLVPSPTQGAIPWLWEKLGSLSLTRGPLIWAGLSPALGLGLTTKALGRRSVSSPLWFGLSSPPSPASGHDMLPSRCQPLPLPASGGKLAPPTSPASRY